MAGVHLPGLTDAARETGQSQNLLARMTEEPPAGVFSALAEPPAGALPKRHEINRTVQESLGVRVCSLKRACAARY